MAKPFSAEQILTFERVLRRRLHPTEIASGKLDRQPKPLPVPSRGMSDAELEKFAFDLPFRNEYKPVAQKPATVDDSYSEMIADAERQVESERLLKMSPAEQQLHFLKQGKKDLAIQQAGEAAAKEHAAHYEATIKALNELLEEADANPFFSLEDVKHVHDTIEQIQFGPTGDAATTAAMLAQVVKIKANNLQLRKDDFANGLRQAGLDEADITAAVAKRFDAKKETPIPLATDTNGDPEWFGLVDKADELKDAFQKLKADKNADPVALDKARTAWMECVQATKASREKYEAEQAASSGDAAE